MKIMQNTEKKKCCNLCKYLSIHTLLDERFLSELEKFYQIIILAHLNCQKFLKKNSHYLFHQINENLFYKLKISKTYKFINFFMQFLHNKKFKNQTCMTLIKFF